MRTSADTSANFIAKVADFSLSKTGLELNQTHVRTTVKGSFSYLDPKYFRRQQLTEKLDVYSFRVVLMEVLCTRPALNPFILENKVVLIQSKKNYICVSHFGTEGVHDKKSQ
ncbi:putative protein kinase RLK-Pelle-CrRLK1L-1 family [Medicago truncatula]|uniref:Receptor-like kinase n=1 Tax=Medicago truncatula TaxID=3880 RepID=A0A072VB25_MEDTR|nr:receptor-like kinase [Medicago truncatula]RHN75178.1 putative protein kinase RLK-Pelle-CrRLK1L-1 family [Medicago truncatula]